MSRRLDILIVDDSEDDRELYSRFMSSETDIDWRIFEAETGAKGLEIYRSHDIDCVLLDYSLPGQDGLEVLREFKGGSLHVPIVILTGQGNEAIATEAMKNGAQDYLPKGSLTPEALVRSVCNTVERVRMLRRIEEQQEARRTFARMMAHDLKEPLNVIRGMNRLIAEAARENEPDEIPELSQRVDRAARRMTELIDTLRKFEKASEGTFEFKPVAMDDMARDAIANLDTVIEARGAEVVIGHLPDVVACPPLMVQLLQNLFANAIKYCEAPSPRVQVYGSDTRDAWEFVIEDNGIGIPDEFREYIFEPLHRLHGYDEYEGSGIGLATCRKIVQRHGGRIWCRDASTGTAFHFTISKTDVDDRPGLAA